MKIIRNKWTRFIVFLTVLAMVCGCILAVLNMVSEYEKYEGSYPLKREELSVEAERLYTDLWAFSAIYLRNLDDNGALSSTSFKTPYIKEAIKLLGFDADDGTVQLRDSESFDYSVSFGNRHEISNTDTFVRDHYTINAEGSDILNVAEYIYGIYNNGCWYYTNGKGFEYYYLAYYNRGIALYDYDTTGLQSYVDELGATIFLNEDGSSPVPTVFMEKDAQFTPAKGYVPFFEGEQAGINISFRLKENLLSVIDAYYSQKESLQQKITDSVMRFIPVAAVIMILSVYLIFTAGYDSREQKYKVTGLKIYTEIHLIAVFFAIVALKLLLGTDMLFELKNVLSPDVYDISIKAIYLFGICGAYTVIVFALSSIVLRIRCRKLTDTTVVLIIIRTAFRLMKKAIRSLRRTIKENRISRQMIKGNEYLKRFLIRTAAALIAAIALFLLLAPSRNLTIIIFVMLVIVFAYVFFCVKDMRELSDLSEHIRRISRGDYTVFDVSESAATYGMHTHLNNISSGVEEAVENQLKSERMKIDLVTNVSHDLKTPLTSIISYIDLLSKEELTPEARDYVTVLENKAGKLKSMVSDVFDLAKATSGTDVISERIDAVVLLGQVLGDLDDKIRQSGKEIRKNITPETAPIMADGKKLYRVMQNLIDNALKYSLDGTRIYITLDNVDDNTIIKVQNISSYEMDFSAEEITERFVRGDQARTGDGNGLGLSIAKSYTEAVGGSFSIELNGDSFTAVTAFPITEE